MNSDLKKYAQASQISPWLTGALSTVLPGSGFLVLGMPAAAAQSFLLTGISSWATYGLYDRGLKGAAIAAGMVTSVFYIGGIQATVRSTNEWNFQQESSSRQKLIEQCVPQIQFEWSKSL